MEILKKTSSAGKIAAVFAFFLPFVVSRNLFTSSVNAKVFYVVLIVAVLILWFVYTLFKKKKEITLRGRWFLGLAALLLVVYYLAAFFGVYPERSFLSDLNRGTGVFFLTFCALFAFWLGEMLKKSDWTLLRRSVGVSAVLYSLLTFLGPEGIGLGGSFFSISALTFGNTTFAGAYLLFAFVFILIEFFESKRSLKDWLTHGISLLVIFFSPTFLGGYLFFSSFSFLTVLSKPSLFFGNARASAIAIIAVLVYILGIALIRWFSRRSLSAESRRRKFLHAWRGLWILAIVSGIILIFVPGSFIQKQYINESTPARIIVWNAGLSAFAEKPIFGWGPENYRFAHESHLEKDLLKPENIGELWFDRAHNFVVDTLVSIGIVGMLLTLIVSIFFLRVVVKARKRGVIKSYHAELLGALLFAHFLQLQTGFETIGTYFIVSVVFGYGLWLEREINKEGSEEGVISDESTSPEKNHTVSYVVGVVLVLSVFVGGKYILVDEYPRQRAITNLFRAVNSSEQEELSKKAFTRISDLASLRLASNSLSKGVLFTLSQPNMTLEKVQTITSSALEQMSFYEDIYIQYLEHVPIDFRARLNYAYLLLNMTVLGENRTEDIDTLLSEAQSIVSANDPTVSILRTLNRLYSGDMEGARAEIDEAVARNPGIPMVLQMERYISLQEQSHPNISPINVENL